MMINAQPNDMSDKDIEKLNQDIDQDEDRLIFQTEEQRRRYRQMLVDQKHRDYIDDEDEITTVINKLGHRIWHRITD